MRVKPCMSKGPLMARTAVIQMETGNQSWGYLYCNMYHFVRNGRFPHNMNNHNTCNIVTQDIWILRTVIHSWQKRLLHPGMMCLFVIISISSVREVKGQVVWCNIMFSMYLMPNFLFCCVLSVLTTFDDKISNWPNVHTLMSLENNCGKFGRTKMIFFVTLPGGRVLCVPGQYRVFPPLAAIIAASRRGILATRRWRRCTGICAHLSSRAWRSSSRFWGGLSIELIARPN